MTKPKRPADNQISPAEQAELDRLRTAEQFDELAQQGKQDGQVSPAEAYESRDPDAPHAT